MAGDSLLLTDGSYLNLVDDSSHLLLAEQPGGGEAEGGGTIFGDVTLLVQFSPTTDPLDTPEWVDITSYVHIPSGITIRRGNRSNEFSKFTAGSLSLSLKNTTRLFDPGYSSGSYYGNLKPMRRIRVRVSYSTTTRSLFHGFILGWPQEYDLSNRWSYVPIQAVDAFDLLNAADVSDSFFELDDSVFGVLNQNRLGGESIPVPEELAGARVDRVLDLVDWPATERDVDDGLSLLAANGLSGSALSYLNRIADSEDGFVFVDADGQITFRERSSRWEATRQTVVQFTLDDDGTDAKYSGVRVDYDRDLIVNEVGRAREGGTVQYASNPTSRQTYGRRRDEVTNLLVASDAEALARAEYRVKRFALPLQRPTPIEVKPLAAKSQIPALIGLELLDRVTLHRRPMGGTVQTFTGALQSIEHRIGADWRCVLSIAPGEIDDTNYFTLDTDLLNTGVLAY